MSEYTPTTDDIKFGYAMHKSIANSRTSATGMGTKLGVHFDEFDRWLAEHDRVVAERAWDQGFTRGFYGGQAWPDGADASEPDIDNPYRKEQENNNA